jgi:trans-aconitate 2-methyltransferase
LGDAWDPAQYAMFRGERAQPFHDLLALVHPHPGMRVVDLGCGTGELTTRLAERLPEATVLGLDASPAMLADAGPRASARVSFRLADIGTFAGWEQWDLVFSNAALQWVSDHERLFADVFSALRPSAQVAVQMPKNGAHPSHRVAAEIAAEPAWVKRLDGFVRVEPTLTAERYAELLEAHGFNYTCFEKIYGHRLPSTLGVVDWVRGTLLTPYLARLDAGQQVDFVSAYRDRLIAELGDEAPYFYPFRRLLFWGRKAPE